MRAQWLLLLCLCFSALGEQPPVFSVVRPCDDVYDDLLGAMGKELAASYVFARLTGDGTRAYYNDEIELRLQRAALLACRDAEEAYAKKALEPYGDQGGASHANLTNHVNFLRGYFGRISSTNPGTATPEDEYYAWRLATQHYEMVSVMRAAHPWLRHSSKIRQMVRDFVNAQITKSVECRIYSRRKQVQEQNACHDLFLYNAWAFSVMFRDNAPKWASQTQYFASWHQYYESYRQSYANHLIGITNVVQNIDRVMAGLGGAINNALGSAYAASLAVANYQRIADHYYGLWMASVNSGRPDWNLCNLVYYYAGLRDQNYQAMQAFLNWVNGAAKPEMGRLQAQRNDMTNAYGIYSKALTQTIEAMMITRQNIAGIGI